MGINWKKKLESITGPAKVNIAGEPAATFIHRLPDPVPKEPGAVEGYPGDRSTPDLAYAIQPGAGVSVGSSPTRLFKLNKARIYASIVNDDASVDLYVSLGPTAALNSGIRLMPGGSFEFGLSTFPPYVGEVYGIAASPINVVVTEI